MWLPDDDLPEWKVRNHWWFRVCMVSLFFIAPVAVITGQWLLAGTALVLGTVAGARS